MATLDWIAGQEPSTISFKVRTVTQNQNSTVMHQEVLTIGGTESTLALAAVLDSAPASTAWAVAVRQVAPSTGPFVISSIVGVVATTGDSTVLQGTSPWVVSGASTVVVASGNSSVIVTSGNSSVIITSGNSSVTVSAFAAGLLSTATPATNSSGVNVWAVGGVLSSLAGIVAVRPSDTNWASSAGFHFNSSGELQTVVAVTTSTIVTVSTGSVRVHQSTAADLQATVTQASTTWAVQLTNYSTQVAITAGGVLESGTSAPSTGARGLFTREVLPGLQSFAASTAFNNSSVITIASSNAAQRAFVYAYSIISTITAFQQVGFYSTNAGTSSLVWSLGLHATSSAISGANLAVTPPAYLFASSTGAALTVNVPTTNAGMTVSVAYWVST